MTKEKERKTVCVDELASPPSLLKLSNSPQFKELLEG